MMILVKIIYFGCDAMYKCFENIIKSGHQIIKLYTYYNPYDIIHEKKIVSKAKELSISYTYDRIDIKTANNIFNNKLCDCFFSAEYNRMIPVSDSPNFKGINVHSSYLPEGKGFFPVEMRAFLKQNYTGVTFHKLTKQFDDGNILIRKKFQIPSNSNVLDIYTKCEEEASKICLEIFKSEESFEYYWKNAYPQKGQTSIFYPSKLERTINKDMSVDEAVHLFKCFDRFTFLNYNNIIYRVLFLKTSDGEQIVNRKNEFANQNDYKKFYLRNGFIWVVLEQIS